jgi:hypothetical protein
MEDQPLLVFALERDAPELRALRDALLAEDYPASIGLGIAGDATESELRSPDWETAFVRWAEPVAHEICLVERLSRGQEEVAEDAIQQHLEAVAGQSDETGKLIVSDHLSRTQVVFAVQLLPALLQDEDHPAWEALDVILLSLAQQTEGIIYVEQEGYCDSDGELLLAEPEDSTPVLRLVEGQRQPEARN